MQLILFHMGGGGMKGGGGRQREEGGRFYLFSDYLLSQVGWGWRRTTKFGELA